IERADVAMIVLDGRAGIDEQDQPIARNTHEMGKDSVLVVNQWDAVRKDDMTMHRFTREAREQFQLMRYAPVVFLSAKTGARVGKLLPVVRAAAESHAMRVPTYLINEVIVDAVAVTPSPSDRGRRLRIGYATQVGVKPPT